MSHLAIIGPQLLPSRPQFEVGGIIFQHPNINPLVAEMYLAASRSARRLGVEVSFPSARPGIERRAQWVTAVHRLANADAVFAIFVGESQAIPIEASLARLMNLPLVVAAIDTHFTGPFEEAGVPIIDARRGADEVEQAIRRLLGREMMR